MRYVITEYAPVWEKAQWAVEVPDEMPEDERTDYVREQAMAGKAELVWKEVEDNIESMDSDWSDPEPEV